MEKHESEKMHHLEDTMWWYAGLHANLLTALQTAITHSNGAILDAGCGTGGLLRTFGSVFPRLFPVGLDKDEAACQLALLKGGCPVCVGSINSLPFIDGAFAAIVCADVLCHRSVDEAEAARGLYRCLAPQGILVINVPAYQWMYSSHDRAVDTARRYTRSRICAVLARGGFTEIHVTHWNALLFPLMALHRIATRGRKKGRSDLISYPRPIESAFRAAMRVENVLLARGVRIPFGGSVLAVAIKQ